MKTTAPPDPNTRKPSFKPPPLACDAHCHVFGPAAKFPYAPDAPYWPPDSPFEALQRLHKTLGIERAVIVHASCHGADMRVTLDAIARSGGKYRGTAIIDPSYTEKQFQAAMVAAVNQARRSLGLRALEVITDARLRRIACARDLDTDRIIQGLPGATRLFVFSRAEPGPLPDDLRRVVDDPQLERLNIGVCLETGGKTGFSKFWVVAAFYH